MNIDDFAISSKALYKILKEKDVEFLYHANTVSTSLTFINQLALLSRHQIEKENLLQSVQKSDTIDKKYDVWDHVYLDGTDHHVKYSRANFYGPVIFRMKLDMLTAPSLSKVFIMKSNPITWNDRTTLENKFYIDIDDVNRDYLSGKKLDSQIMFTFRKPEKTIKLKSFLHSIGIDEPNIILKLNSGNISTGNYVRNIIQDALNNNGLKHIPLLKRHAKSIAWCRCQIQYNLMYQFDMNEFKKRFSRNPT